MRFSSEPPQWSVRWLASGDRNCVDQVAVGAVDLDEVEAGAHRALGGVGEGADEALDAALVERRRHVPVGREGDGRRRHRLPGDPPAGAQRAAALPRAVGGGLAAGMGELDAEAGAVRRHAAGGGQRALRGRFVVIGVEAEAAVGDAAMALDPGRLDGDHAGAGHGERHPVLQVPVGRRAVVGGVLAHGRDGDAVRDSVMPPRVSGEKSAEVIWLPGKSGKEGLREWH